MDQQGKIQRSIAKTVTKSWHLYVLKLEQDKWYVGVTSNTVEYRFSQHKKGFAGAAWTKKYYPLIIFDQKDLGLMTYESAEKYESKVVRAYIKKYGMNNVRGGDLRDTEDYVRRFGWYLVKDGWEVITVISLLLLTIVYLVILYYTK